LRVFQTVAVPIKPIRVLSVEWNGGLQKLERAKKSRSMAQKICLSVSEWNEQLFEKLSIFAAHRTLPSLGLGRW
jgi:hypothetical protein